MKNLNCLKCPVGIVVLLSFFLGCKSDDDGEPGFQRTVVIEEISDAITARDIDWNDVELVWSENFNESSLSDAVWTYSENSPDPDTENHLQTYTDQNAKISGSILQLQAKKTGAGQNKGDYTSSRISTDFAFQYGRVEISAKLPESEKNGIWAKLSMLGNNIDTVGWPLCGEINLMEYLGHRPNETYNIVHIGENGNGQGMLVSPMYELDTIEEEFHTYGLLWTKDYLKFYIDDLDNITYTVEKPALPTEANWPFDQPFYILADLVVGGEYGGAEGVDDSMFPATMEIAYIRVYHLK